MIDIQIELFRRTKLWGTRDYLKWTMNILFQKSLTGATWKNDVQWIKIDPKDMLSSRVTFSPSVLLAAGWLCSLREIIYTDFMFWRGLAQRKLPSPGQGHWLDFADRMKWCQFWQQLPKFKPLCMSQLQKLSNIFRTLSKIVLVWCLSNPLSSSRAGRKKSYISTGD